MRLSWSRTAGEKFGIHDLEDRDDSEVVFKVSIDQRVCRSDELLPSLVVTSLSEGVAEPLETLIKTITRSSAGGLDIPGTLSQAM